MTALVVRSEDWPHGLRCVNCDRELVDGDQYSEELEGFIDTSALGVVPSVRIICAECAIAKSLGMGE